MFVLCRVNIVLSLECSDGFLEFVPAGLIIWLYKDLIVVYVSYKLIVDVEFVEDGVPGSVELSDGVVVLQGEVVATAVASGELWVHTAQSVHGLVDVSQIVDQKAESVGLSSGFIVVVVLHYSSVSVTLLVVSLIRQPVDNVGDVLGDVVHILLELGVVLEVATLVEVGDVNEVPVGLPAATLVLDLVSEGGTLNEGVLVLTVGDSLACHC